MTLPSLFDRQSSRLTYTLDGSTARVTLHTQLVDEAAATLKRTGEMLIADGHVRLTIDCRDVPYAGAAGLNTLVSLAKRAERAGGSITLEHVNPDLRELLRMTRIDTLFEIVECASPTPNGEAER